jgi:hypothetical protein
LKDMRLVPFPQFLLAVGEVAVIIGFIAAHGGLSPASHTGGQGGGPPPRRMQEARRSAYGRVRVRKRRGLTRRVASDFAGILFQVEGFSPATRL